MPPLLPKGGIGNLPGEVAGALGDWFTHPIPSAKPHDPVQAALAPKQKVKLSTLIGKYTDWDVRTATAVALAESRGRVNARGGPNSDGSYDHGLMQINDKAHPSYDVKRLESDPEYNIAAGHDVWKSSGWGAWSTYNSGAYKLFLGHDATITMDPRAGTIYQDSPAATINDAATTGIDAIGNIVSALGNPGTWLRLGKGTLGGVLIIVGVGGITFVVANKAGNLPVVKQVTKVIP